MSKQLWETLHKILQVIRPISLPGPTLEGGTNQEIYIKNNSFLDVDVLRFG
ncbi:UNVERIFIED_CONTAM: hypothetical protein ABID98_002204 [Brevibacillus sp. OAP136]